MKLLKLINTVKYLKFIQLYYRLHYILLKPTTNKANFNIKLKHIDMNWINVVDKPISMISPNTFIFLNHIAQVNTAEDWNSLKQEKLWLYNLHYFDDLNAENNKARVDWHSDLINKWVNENPYALGNAWEPYPNSLRIVNWIKWSLQGNTLNEVQLQSLALQAEHLSKTVEWHILANHLFANAKALIFAGLFFETLESKKWLDLGLKIYKKEIDEQVLSDGGNYELTPMYHSIFLEDLLDIYQILYIYKDLDLIDSSKLKIKINKMLNWLEKMTHPDAEVSFFNDAAIGIAPKYDDLLDYAQAFNVCDGVSNKSKDEYLNQTGYVSVQRSDYKIICDVANLGPDYQPGHGHADTLSFEMSCFGKRFIVNSGTSKYGIDDERLYQRSSEAHNVVVIDNQNSSEVWSGFRVARRVNPKINFLNEKEKQIIDFKASYKSLSGVYVSRYFKFENKKIYIADVLVGKFNEAISYIHFHPDVNIEILNEKEIYCWFTKSQKVSIHVESCQMQLLDTFYYPEFGKKVANKTLKCIFDKNLCNFEIVIN